MVRLLLFLIFFLPVAAAGGTAADIARAIRESGFDREECYRVRDLSFVKEDIRLYLTDGHLIFSKPIAGHRVAAVFAADVEGGDGEVILFTPDRAERRSLSAFIDAPNLDDHFRAVVLLFTGDVYEQLKKQIAENPGNRKAPEIAPVLDQTWSPVLRNLGTSYQVRSRSIRARPSEADSLPRSSAATNLGISTSSTIPITPSSHGRPINNRQDHIYFDTWTSFPSCSARKDPKPVLRDAEMQDYRIDATVAPDLAQRRHRVKVRVRSGYP